MASAAARERYARKNEAADLKRAFNALDSKGDGKIDPEELNAVFQALGHKPRRGEVDDLIWEVDEDCDGCISWQEFQRMYHRCRQDSTGASACVASLAAHSSSCLSRSRARVCRQLLGLRASVLALTSTPASSRVSPH